MSVDKFGRHERSFAHEVFRGPPGDGFQLTQDGNYDLKRKRLCNLADPLSNEEAVNLKIIRTLTLNCESADGMFDAKNKRIQNIAKASEDNDAVNREFVLGEINKLKNNLNEKIDKISSRLFSIFPSKKDANELSHRDEKYVYIGENDTEGTLPLLTFNELNQ